MHYMIALYLVSVVERRSRTSQYSVASLHPWVWGCGSTLSEPDGPVGVLLALSIVPEGVVGVLAIDELEHSECVVLGAVWV